MRAREDVDAPGNAPALRGVGQVRLRPCRWREHAGHIQQAAYMRSSRFISHETTHDHRPGPVSRQTLTAKYQMCVTRVEVR
jgi:hypothetical protein